MSAVLPIQSDEIVSYNPATGEEVGRVPQMSVDEVKTAVERSRAAFQSWKKTSFTQRSFYIMKAREVILSEMDEIEAMEKLQKHMRDTKNNKEFFEAMTRAR